MLPEPCRRCAVRASASGSDFSKSDRVPPPALTPSKPPQTFSISLWTVAAPSAAGSHGARSQNIAGAMPPMRCARISERLRFSELVGCRPPAPTPEQSQPETFFDCTTNPDASKRDRIDLYVKGVRGYSPPTKETSPARRGTTRKMRVAGGRGRSERSESSPPHEATRMPLKGAMKVLPVPEAG